MKVLARIAAIVALMINVLAVIFDSIHGAWIASGISVVAICIILAFSAKIDLWSKEPWVWNEK